MEENRYTPSTPESEDDPQQPPSSSYPSAVMRAGPFPSPSILYSASTQQDVVESAQQSPYRYVQPQQSHHPSEWRSGPYGAGEHGQALRQQSDAVGYPESSQRTTFAVAARRPSAPPYAFPVYEGVPPPVNHPAHPFYSASTYPTSFAGATQSSIAIHDQNPSLGPFGPGSIAHPSQIQPSYTQTPNQPLSPIMGSEPFSQQGQHPHVYSQAAPARGSRPPPHVNLCPPHPSFPHQNIYPPQPYQEGQDHHLPQQEHYQQPARPFDPVYPSPMDQSSHPPPESPEPVPRLSPGHYWPRSPASEPSWAGRPTEDDPPSFERGDTPQSDGPGRFGGYSFDDDFVDEDDTVTPGTPKGGCPVPRRVMSGLLGYDIDGGGKGKEKEAPAKDGDPAPDQKKPKRKSKYHECSVCHKSFPRPSGLATHMNSHTGSRPFKCKVPGCDKRFAVRSNAKRHLRTHGLSPEHESGPAVPPFVVGFQEPVVSDNVQSTQRRPHALKWVQENKEQGLLPDLSRGSTRPRWAPASAEAGPSRVPGGRNIAGGSGGPPQQQQEAPSTSQRHAQRPTRGDTGLRARYAASGGGGGGSSRQLGRSVDAHGDNENEEDEEEGGDDGRRSVGGRRNTNYPS